MTGLNEQALQQLEANLPGDAAKIKAAIQGLKTLISQNTSAIGTLEADVSAAKTDATDAKGIAEDAKTTADGIAATANTAKTTADAAQSTADAALAKATANEAGINRILAVLTGEAAQIDETTFAS